MSNEFIKKKLTFLTDHITEIINEYSKSDSTAARVRKSFFLKKKYLGSKDRKCITGAFYFYFRHYPFAKELNAETLLLLAYNFDTEVSFALNKLIKNIDITEFITNTYSISDTIIDEFDSLSSINFFPTVFIENININSNELEQLCDSLNKAATTDIRIIKNKGLVVNELDTLGIDYYTNILPDCVKLKDNANLDNTKSYREGYFEIQDEGSQLIATALNPSSGETILDYCAGGGGKSLHIAQLANDKSRITATDISSNRLNETKRRVSKLGLKSISVKEINDVNSNNLTYDKVLVDAPCTGSGTVRRAPDIRVRITDEDIKRYHRLQLEILGNVADKIQPGGVLLYSTCSLFDKENDDTITEFLSLHPEFNVLNTTTKLNQTGIDTTKFTNKTHGIQTYTHKADMDSFYICTLEKSL